MLLLGIWEWLQELQERTVRKAESNCGDLARRREEALSFLLTESVGEQGKDDEVQVVRMGWRKQMQSQWKVQGFRRNASYETILKILERKLIEMLILILLVFLTERSYILGQSEDFLRESVRPFHAKRANEFAAHQTVLKMRSIKICDN